MQIISQVDEVELVAFGDLSTGDVFQRQGSKKLYLKSGHSVEGSNAVRLATGLRSTFEDEEEVIVRADACVRFDADEG